MFMGEMGEADFPWFEKRRAVAAVNKKSQVEQAVGLIIKNVNVLVKLFVWLFIITRFFLLTTNLFHLQKMSIKVLTSTCI